tara:strand:- start:1300 stop:1623 length:324 start_codon:yes stop_codon:yes gene_type:complete
MKGRTPTKAEKDHMDRVRDLGCIICRQQGMGRVPCEIHHVYGKTKPGAHFYVLPLCFQHHRMGSDKEPISRHPWKARFVATYGTEEHLLKLVDELLDLDAYADTLPF